MRDGDRAKIRPLRTGFVERAIDDAADIANVLAGRELRHDTAPLAMDRHLRRDDIRPDRPRLRRIAGLFDHGGRRFIAGRFDTEDSHGLFV